MTLGKSIYDKQCAACHGKNGEGDADRFYPRLHGQHYRYLVRQIEWIRDGKRRNGIPLMALQIKNMSGADVKAVADYISRLKPPAHIVKRPGEKAGLLELAPTGKKDLDGGTLL